MYIITEERFLTALSDYYSTGALKMEDVPLPQSPKDLLYLINFINNYEEKNVSLDDIVDMSCRYFKIERRQMVSRNRKRNIVTPRHMIQSGISNIFKQFTLTDVGNATGKKDHTTVIHAKRSIRNLCDTEPDVKSVYENFVSFLILIANGKKVA